jgi:hypothetical protein
MITVRVAGVPPHVDLEEFQRVLLSYAGASGARLDRNAGVGHVDFGDLLAAQVGVPVCLPA